MSKQYGYITTMTRTGICNVIRVVLGGNDRYSCHTQFIHSNNLYTTSDQDIDLIGNGGKGYTLQSIGKFKWIKFNGSTIYKRPWYKF